VVQREDVTLVSCDKLQRDGVGGARGAKVKIRQKKKFVTYTKKQLQEDFVCCRWRAVSKIKKKTYFLLFPKKESPSNKNNNTEGRSTFLKWCNFSLGRPVWSLYLL
jgi:hypothetical protein